MCSAELGWTHATLSGTTSVFHPRSWKAFQNPSPESVSRIARVAARVFRRARGHAISREDRQPHSDSLLSSGAPLIWNHVAGTP